MVENTVCCLSYVGRRKLNPSLHQIISVWNLQKSYLPWYCPVITLSWKDDVAVQIPVQGLIQGLLNSVRKLPLASAPTVAEPQPFTPQPLLPANVCDICNSE